MVCHHFCEASIFNMHTFYTCVECMVMHISAQLAEFELQNVWNMISTLKTYRSHYGGEVKTVWAVFWLQVCSSRTKWRQKLKTMNKAQCSKWELFSFDIVSFDYVPWIVHDGLGNGLVPNMCQAIILTIEEPIQRRIYSAIMRAMLY